MLSSFTFQRVKSLLYFILLNHPFIIGISFQSKPITNPSKSFIPTYHRHQHFQNRRQTVKQILKMTTTTNKNDNDNDIDIDIDINTNSNINDRRLLLSSTYFQTNKERSHLILASQSPRRAEILDMMGLKNQYIATPSPLNESKLQLELRSRDVKPLEYVELLSKNKAKAMAETLVTESGHEYYILGSDTIVDLNGTILEKPTDENNAFDMLTRLSGNHHCVHTGVAIYYVSPLKEITCLSSFVETTKVKFTDLTEQDILSYVGTGEPMDKAGSYGIQGIGGQMVEKIDGDYFTVMGLPMHKLSVELTKAIAIQKN